MGYIVKCVAVVLLVLLGVAACGDNTELPAAAPFGPKPDDLQLREAVASDATVFRLTDADPLLRPNLGRTRYLKIGSEWVEYTVRDVMWGTREVHVRRGRRGSKAQAHPSGTSCYVLVSPLPESSK